MTTQFDNLTDAHLADEIGSLDLEAKRIEKRLKAAKAEFKARGIDQAEGGDYVVTAKTSIRISLDTTKIKEVMTPAWVDDFSRMAEVTTLRVATA